MRHEYIGSGFPMPSLQLWKRIRPDPDDGSDPGGELFNDDPVSTQQRPYASSSSRIFWNFSNLPPPPPRSIKPLSAIPELHPKLTTTARKQQQQQQLANAREEEEEESSSQPMMDSPFFRSHWVAPSHPRPRYYPSPAPPRAVPTRAGAAPSPKVVSIPVRFVGSERSRSGSAVRIQSAFRGFLVRRSVGRIAAVRREVDEVERRISTAEAAELLRRDERERLKVSETLMSLLLRLDSVRGVDAGVRECRKAVIRRAIALQERVDAIVAGQSGGPVGGGSAGEADVEGGDAAGRESVEADDRRSGALPPLSTTEAVMARSEGESGPEMADADQSVDAGSESHQTEETPAEPEVRTAPVADVAAKPEGEHSVEADAGRDREMGQPAADGADAEAAREPETEILANEDGITADNYTVQSTCEGVEDAVATGTESSADSSAHSRSPIEGIDENAPPGEGAAVESQKPHKNEERGGWGRARSCWRGWRRTTRR
ncbi:hypothetical protein NL676_019929 [Syzygium grande]|nr:hypothetical protein NL676_019929 [Syzygium grande]